MHLGPETSLRVDRCVDHRHRQGGGDGAGAGGAAARAAGVGPVAVPRLHAGRRDLRALAALVREPRDARGAGAKNTSP